jgi:hypothetical protein
MIHVTAIITPYGPAKSRRTRHLFGNGDCAARGIRSADAVEAADLVILLQARSAFDLDAVAGHAQACLDTRGASRGGIVSDPGGVSSQTRITG